MTLKKVMLGYISMGLKIILKIDLSSWIGGNPKDILKSNFCFTDDIINKFPKSDQLIIRQKIKE
ncbi:hypothetical protein [Chryseobacterium carnipullorum]|uniref:hypothetical protein n=1 Tax=Chryseobacterium carnipullorum TaxID=1124835 RepID=UPI000E7DAE06|nr:hypothetical protein [Chryseobacterium carnipullorum]HBV15196.1 hypothetical protein [Chryseobacterium carnipullorum]